MLSTKIFRKILNVHISFFSHCGSGSGCAYIGVKQYEKLCSPARGECLHECG